MRVLLIFFSYLFVFSAQALEPEARVMPSNGIDKALLGQILFFDTTLSKNNRLNCASCHHPDHAFIDVRKNSAEGMVSQGDDPYRFGRRNSPTMLYAKYTPEFHFDEASQAYVGGLFWDGRAKDLQQQAGNPPLDPVEMEMPDKRSVAERLWQNPMYARLLTFHYGQEVWDSVEQVYTAMENALATFQREKPLLAPFDSKYDKFLKGEIALTPLENQGRALFFDKNGANCASCHQLRSTQTAMEETFTNYHYYNIGVPKNRQLLIHNHLAENTVDLGLFENPLVNGDEKQKAKFKVPTLRNVAVTSPYMHNGVFKELRTVLLFLDHFNHSDRQINPETHRLWDEPEYAPTVNYNELKAKALTDQEIDALEAFLRTLTDERYEPLLSQ
ncbi:methylamine utilization protein MauG [Vespertiliibacter pulmonis]|uniref:Cytochrome c peroxidase n=1 Tax=Vespertiliibacter pulmonis TaxID=1443036 RepID=A0A3N4VDW6_9PAST|nr:cytochrome c peroxidase [Vespertiliibacter pulmonis]QLB20520.1 methylamine utilization protein MauG [Vespertiliibacter pulmonis]RPE80828.1 cytochrome c peroxidase [Vespertiliibacter pulmonis]